MPDKLIIPSEMVDVMRAHIQRSIPEEACGILGGNGNLVKCVIPDTNELHSPLKFRMAPEEQYKAFTWLENKAYDMLGYYHSHPVGPAFPSETDLRQFSYPGVVIVLLSPENSTWKIKGFIIRDNAIEEVDIENSI